MVRTSELPTGHGRASSVNPGIFALGGRLLPVTIPLPATWTARWIEPVEAPDGPAVQRPVHHMAGEITIAAPVIRAVLFATAHGVFEAFVNGERIGDCELTPGFTAYRARLPVHAFDVTGLVR